MLLELPIYGALFIVFATVLLLNAFSSALRRFWMPEPLIALVVGVLVGPYVFGWIDLKSDIEHKLMLEFSRITLAIGLMGVALRIPDNYWQRHWKFVALILGVAMPIMWLVASGILWWGLGLPVWVALLCGACITPTDPIVSTPIVTGAVANEYLTNRVRRNLSAESGINDGLGFLFVVLPVLMLTAAGSAPVQEWLTHVLLYQVVLASVVAAAVGWAAALLLKVSEKHELISPPALLGYSLCLSLLLISTGRWMQVDGVLMVMIGGIIFRIFISRRDDEEEDRVQETINRFFIIPVFIGIGIVLPLEEWNKLGWSSLLIIAAAVVLRRFLTLMLLKPLLGRLMPPGEVWFLSWFGAVGVSALFYAMHATEKTHLHEVWPIVSFALLFSVVAHGMTATPFSQWLHRKQARDASSSS